MVVDERVAGDAGADAQRERERRHVRRVAPDAAHQQHAGGHREHAGDGREADRDASTITEISSTSTGADPRAIG